MKTYDEYMDNIQRKAKAIKKRRRIMVSSVTAVFVLALVLSIGLFQPLGGNDGDIHSPTGGKPWNNSTGKNPIAAVNGYSQLAQKLKSIQFDMLYEIEAGVNSPSDDGDTGTDMPDQTYQEVTDNQVSGVIEGDLFKRSDKYLYHLDEKQISIYTIEKEESELVSSFPAFEEKDGLFMASYRSEMFLSADCKTLTVIGYGRYDEHYHTVVSQIDVSDPVNVRRTEQVYFAGRYLSARMVDGDIMLNYQFTFAPEDIDENDLKSFVPTYGALEDMQPVDVENIYCYDQPYDSLYTVVVRLGEDLTVKDMVALLGYSSQIYVSNNCVYLTCPDILRTGEQDYICKYVTTIAGVSYADGQLQFLGTVQVDGHLENQYYMDEYKGVLRVATSTWIRQYKTDISDDGEYSWKTWESSKNCNLYCIDLASGEILSSVVGFAPEGEEVTSARFVGTNAYICTAEKINLSDPVYFFDLSDVNSITYKHTPIIDGYSTSLINFGEYLVGIGINGEREAKVEAYCQTETGVVSAAVYEPQAVTASTYKAFLIDREKQLIGLPLTMGEQRYVELIHFNGQEFTVLKTVYLQEVISLDRVRSTMIDGYLYVLGTDLQVVQVY